MLHEINCKTHAKQSLWFIICTSLTPLTGADSQDLDASSQWVYWFDNKDWWCLFMLSKCVNGYLKLRLWVASVLSREPPGEELTYFLWLPSFWVQPLCNTVAQFLYFLFTFYPCKHAQEPISYSNKYSACRRYENAAGPSPGTCEWDLLRRYSEFLCVRVCVCQALGEPCRWGVSLRVCWICLPVWWAARASWCLSLSR